MSDVKKTTLTTDEFLALCGLLSLGMAANRRRNEFLHQIEKICGEEEDSCGHCMDAMWEGYSAQELLKKLDLTVVPDNAAFEKFIHDPEVVWYGPHECEVCRVRIIKSSMESGGVKLDAPHGHHYPNFQWTKHECRDTRLDL